MANTGASDGNQSQDDDRGLQTIWRSINKQQQSIQNLTQQLETIKKQLQALLSINGQGRRNDDEEHGGGIGPLDSLLIPFQIYKIKGGQFQYLLTL